MSDRIKATLTSPDESSSTFIWEGGEGWLLGEITAESAILILQVLGPLGGWIDTDICITESGIKVFYLPPKVEARLSSTNTSATYKALLIQDTRRTDFAT